MTPRDRALVVGGDGLIGAAVADALHDAGAVVLATTRHPDRVSASRFWLDLADPSSWSDLPATELAFLCAADASYARCAVDPDATRQVNVLNLADLAARLHDRGARVVVPSSTAVFDGRTPHRPASDRVCPISEYGRQKAELESRVLRLDRAIVVRLAKVFGLWPGVLASWRRALLAGDAIDAFVDLVMAPVTRSLAAAALVTPALAGASGMFQLSARQDVSYEATARRLAERLGAPATLVRKASARASGLPPGAMPAHTTMDVTRLADEWGIAAPDAWATIDAVTPS